MLMDNVEVCLGLGEGIQLFGAADRCGSETDTARLRGEVFEYMRGWGPATHLHEPAMAVFGLIAKGAIGTPVRVGPD
ncbi:MAG: hypothetical protein A3K19_19945 [Lentisphaerae bacterium RIFOXYB12_FULL_65_16]|nr:MAG: hypothetical protein A3K18_07225 [Lentisphaerae bacterium RIFOXYA12_64_32]OGV85082.1 MAG: hypothetical protein A3K19_19945 [Lentisphaerae bacterium RIFOXYB12_FULL_65_16]